MDEIQTMQHALPQDFPQDLPLDLPQDLSQALSPSSIEIDSMQEDAEQFAAGFNLDRIEQLLQMLLAKDAGLPAEPSMALKPVQPVQPTMFETKMKGSTTMQNQKTATVNPNTTYENSTEEDTRMYDFVLQLMQQAEQEKEQEATRKQREEWNDRDLNAFTQAHPDVDLAALLRENPRFSKFGRGRFGTLPLNEIFNDFLEFCSESERTALARNQDRRARTTGSGSGGLVSALTPSQSAALTDWNQTNPDLAMTPKEFLSR